MKCHLKTKLLFCSEMLNNPAERELFYHTRRANSQEHRAVCQWRTVSAMFRFRGAFNFEN